MQTVTFKPQKIYRCQCDRCGKIMTKWGKRAPRWYKHPQGYTHTCFDGGKGHIISEYCGMIDEEFC